MHLARPETPKKGVTKRGRPSGKPNANDYCRICKCQFKLSKCSTINIFERSAREHFKHFILADLCQESSVMLPQANNLSNRVCITCGKKRQIPTTCERSPTARNAKELQLADILPTQDVMNTIQSHFAVLVSRVLVTYVNKLKYLKSCIIKHIPHEYSQHMKTKSDSVRNNTI